MFGSNVCKTTWITVRQQQILLIYAVAEDFLIKLLGHQHRYLHMHLESLLQPTNTEPVPAIYLKTKTKQIIQ